MRDDYVRRIKVRAFAKGDRDFAVDLLAGLFGRDRRGEAGSTDDPEEVGGAEAYATPASRFVTVMCA